MTDLNRFIPNAQQQFLTGDLVSRPWYVFLQRLASGSTGTQGAQGAQGAAGAQGSAGAAGAQGASGATGAQGFTGAQGSQGAVGPMIPYFIASGETFTVPLYKQALFSMPIDNEGTIDAIGYLIEVD